MTRYVVKARRIYGGREATSVLTMPGTLEQAKKHLAKFNETYQTPGNYYIEEWQERA